MGTLDDVEREGWLAEPPQGEHDREGALRTRALRKMPAISIHSPAVVH
jgi:hypothetical protein